MNRILGVIIAACLALAACDADTPPEPTVDQATQQFNQLMQRPDIDQATSRYQQMYAELRRELSAAFPGAGAWSEAAGAGVTSAACGQPFAAVDAGDRVEDDAVTKGLGNWGTSATIPDDRWSNALAIVANVTQRYGFDAHAEVMNSKPGAHDANFYDGYGAQLMFGAGNTMGFVLTTGCHLTVEAKKRGHLAPTQTY